MVSPDTSMSADAWRTVEQGAQEVNEAVTNAFAFSELPDESDHGAERKANEWIGKMKDAAEGLAEFAHSIASDLEDAESEGGDDG
jgi:hypothetical protein